MSPILPTLQLPIKLVRKLPVAALQPFSLQLSASRPQIFKFSSRIQPTSEYRTRQFISINSPSQDIDRYPFYITEDIRSNEYLQ